MIDSDDSSTMASRPQRISGCPQQDGMGINIFDSLENSTPIESEVNTHTPDPPIPPIKKLKKKKKAPVSQEVVTPLQDDLQPGAPLTVDQWMIHQKKVDDRFEQLALSKRPRRNCKSRKPALKHVSKSI